MAPEKRRSTTKMLSVAVSVSGAIVMIGWILDIGILKSISPAWVSMKFDTAVSFVLSGITLYFIAKAAEGEFDKAQVVLSVTTLITVLLMGILFFSALFKIHTGVEDLFVRETQISAKTIIPGRPSTPTMVNFLLISFAAVLTMLNLEKTHSKIKIIGLVVGIIGMSAVTGYLFNAPLLYYYIEGVNSAMACHTAILFILLGVGFVCL